MGALIIHSGTPDNALACAKRSLEQQGFKSPEILSWPGGSVHLYPSLVDSQDNVSWVRYDDDFIACVGFIGFDGQIGQAALRALFNSWRGVDHLHPDQLYGNFQLVLYKHGQLTRFADPLGLINLFCTADASLMSTSWMACAAAQPLTCDPIAIQDYIINGACHSQRTIVRQVSQVMPGSYSQFPGSQFHPWMQASQWQDGDIYANRQTAIDECVDILRTRFGLAAKQAGTVSRTALSGGYDSRLIVATLISSGLQPELFVYGQSHDSDVRVAHAAAAAVGLNLNHIDKRELNTALSQQSVQNNAMAFDATPLDGVFDQGADLATRLNHADSGALVLNGGGGEIFRNFFYLRDRDYSTRELVQAFYHPFHPRVFPNPDQYQQYLAAMSASIDTQVGGHGQLSRGQVELAYPLLRVRFWASRTNSIATRFGKFYTPLVDPLLVRLTQRLPLSWKDYGRFESTLISTLSPPLGKVDMDYGFSPATGPDKKYQANMWLQHRRPPWFRSSTPKLKRLLGLSKSAAVPEIIRTLLPGPWQTDQYIQTDGLVDSSQILRTASVEWLIRRLSIAG